MVLNFFSLDWKGTQGTLNPVFCVLFIFIWKANISFHSEGTFAIRGHFPSEFQTNALEQKSKSFCPQIQTSNHPVFCVLFIFIWKANISFNSEGTFAIRGHFPSEFQWQMHLCRNQKVFALRFRPQTILHRILLQSSLNLTLI